MGIPAEPERPRQHPLRSSGTFTAPKHLDVGLPSSLPVCGQSGLRPPTTLPPARETLCNSTLVTTFSPSHCRALAIRPREQPKMENSKCIYRVRPFPIFGAVCLPSCDLWYSSSIAHQTKISR